MGTPIYICCAIAMGVLNCINIVRVNIPMLLRILNIDAIKNQKERKQVTIDTVNYKFTFFTISFCIDLILVHLR